MASLKAWLVSVLTLFATGCVLFVPFPFHLITFQSGITHFIFGPLVRFTAAVWLHEPLGKTLFVSDSLSLYLLVGWLLVFSLVIAGLIRLIPPPLFRDRRWPYIAETVIRYYLVAVLLRYGADKLVKAQFYLPEPNILFTPAGQLDKDIFFWSAIGSSRLYNMVTGGAECLAAVLLFFHRTRRAGLLFSWLLFVHIALINFSFDISVKLFSLLLLFLTSFLLAREGGHGWRSLFGFSATATGLQAPVRSPVQGFGYLFLKSLAAGLLLLEGFYLYARDGRWNDDRAPRPFLHGAYEVQYIVQGPDTLRPPVLPVKRFFIHRNQYLVFQDAEDHFRDFGLAIDRSAAYFRITGYDNKVRVVPYEWKPADSLLTLQWREGMAEQRIAGRVIPWRELPLVRGGFHWFSDR